jgi:type IV fimbrial biogenesis protein FimT
MRFREPRGFTLVELLIVVSVVAILAEVAIPSFQSLIASQRVKTTASTLQFALLRTRAESLKRNTNVTLAPATAGHWNAGWNVLNPVDGSSLSTYADAAAAGVTITGPATVVFQSSGRLSGAANVNFKLSSTGTTDIRCVLIGPSGMPMVTTSGC